jgi:hypothetical protein
MTHEEAIETLLAMAKVQDGYAAKATDEGLKLIHMANAKAQRQVAELLQAAEAREAKLRATFRVNMLRYGPPGTSHEEIDAMVNGEAK